MARNKKFAKLGINENYSANNEVFGGDDAEIKQNGENNTDGASEKFTYIKTKRNVHDTAKKTDGDIPKAPSAPVILALCCLCLSLAGAFLLNADFVYGLSSAMQSVIKAAISVCVYVIPAVVYVLFRKNGTLYNIKGCSVGYAPFVLVSLGLVVCASALQKYIIAYVFSYRVPVGVQEGNLLVAILVGALVPAVCEEFLVRGILQYEFSKYAGGFGGVLFSALVFTMLHFDLQFFGVYFVAGIVLGALTHVTRSVLPAMLVHFLNNTFSITLSDRLTFVALERIGGTLLIIVLAAVCFILVAVMLQMMEKISTKRAVYYLKGGEKEKSESTAKGIYSGREKEDILFFTAENGGTVRKTARLFVNVFSVVCYVIFAVVVIAAL